MARKAAVAGMAAVCAVLAATALGLQRSRGADFQVSAGVVPEVLYTEEAFGSATGLAPVNANIASDVAADNRRPAVGRPGATPIADTTAEPAPEPAADKTEKTDKPSPDDAGVPADQGRSTKTTLAETTATTARVSPAHDKRGGGNDTTETTSAPPGKSKP